MLKKIKTTKIYSNRNKMPVGKKTTIRLYIIPPNQLFTRSLGHFILPDLLYYVTFLEICKYFIHLFFYALCYSSSVRFVDKQQEATVRVFWNHYIRTAKQSPKRTTAKNTQYTQSHHKLQAFHPRNSVTTLHQVLIITHLLNLIKPQRNTAGYTPIAICH